MVSRKIRKIAILGAGKLATHFSIALKNRGYSIVQVYNRTADAGLALANVLSCSYINSFDELSTDADLYCLALSDSVIESYALKMHFKEQLVVMFSGTLDIQVLNHASDNFGVIYPPQSFTKLKEVNFSEVPLCFEGSNEESTFQLTKLAAALSSTIFPVTFTQRKMLHLAAVFANNFPNFLFSVSERLLNENNLPKELLAPLITQTSANFLHKDIFALQTGPAIREDLEIMKLHLELLSGYPDFQDIYQLISESIIRQKHQNDEL